MNEKEFNRNCDGTDYGNWVPLNMMKAMGGLTGMLALAEILVTALVKKQDALHPAGRGDRRTFAAVALYA